MKKAINKLNKGIILLSGGLDSLVSLDISSKEIDIKLALTFDYGQKAFKEELSASRKIAKKYNIEHKTIKLPFLKEITSNALTEEKYKNLNNFKSVWIPNRNGLFLNIAGCYCDKYNFNYIIFGANKEEAREFPDNSSEFIKYADKFLNYSTLNQPKVYAPCLKFDKISIINYAISNNLDLKDIKSCYNSKKITGKKHCGKCMSCKLLYNAIKNAKRPDLLKEIFE